MPPEAAANSPYTGTLAQLVSRLLRTREMRRVVVIWASILLATVATAVWFGAGPLTGAVFFLAGVVYWSLLEYFLHRFVMHVEPKNRFASVFRKVVPGHRGHHNNPTHPHLIPTNEQFLPIGFFASLVAAGLAVGLSTALALLFAAGVMAG